MTASKTTASKTLGAAKRVAASCVFWAVCMPLSAALIWGIGTAPLFWLYGIVVAVLLAPYLFAACLPGSIWLGARTGSGKHVETPELLVAAAAGSVLVYWTVNPDELPGMTADLPDTNPMGSVSGMVMLAIFAMTGAVAARWIGQRVGFLRKS